MGRRQYWRLGQRPMPGGGRTSPTLFPVLFAEKNRLRDKTPIRAEIREKRNLIFHKSSPSGSPPQFSRVSTSRAGVLQEHVLVFIFFFLESEALEGFWPRNEKGRRIPTSLQGVSTQFTDFSAIRRCPEIRSALHGEVRLSN